MEGRSTTPGSRRERKLRLRVPHARLAASACAALGIVVAGASYSACYSTGNGTNPPPTNFYYPVGLTVSAAGNVLYAVNADFDLQFNGGTVQSYDLSAIRNDTVALMLGIYPGGTAFNSGGLDAGAPASIPFEAGVPPSAYGAACPSTSNNPGIPNPNDPNGWNNEPGRLPLGQACAPPVDSTQYCRDSVTIGAFATDIQLSKNKGRLFIPVRGDATLTWMDVQQDDNGLAAPKATDNPTNYGPFHLLCQGDTNPVTLVTNFARGRLCGTVDPPPKSRAGTLYDPGNTRQLSMPGEPFAMAFSDDGVAIALTHQAENESSLYLAGFLPAASGSSVGTGGTGADAASDADAGPSADAAADAGAASEDGGADASSDDAGDDAGPADAGSLADAGSDASADAGNATDGGVESDAGVEPDAGGTTNFASLGANSFYPSIQFVVQDMPLGGDGIVAVPHDPAAITNPDPANPLRPAFLQTSNLQAEIDLLRYYSDEGYQQNFDASAVPNGIAEGGIGVAVQVGSANLRPFLLKERVYSVSVSPNGTNSRGIAIDPTPRLLCEWQVTHEQNLPTTSPQYVACAQTPARVFIASRSPSSLILGQVGGMSGEGTVYDPDQLTIYGNVPLSAGPSNVYVAPVVDKNGRYAVRVFIVCFDSQTIAIYDPDAQRIENVVTTGPGPFGMAFDPFDIEAVATHAIVPQDPRSRYPNIVGGKIVGQALRTYRFAYITSFTDSFVQVMDLDQSFKDDRLGVGGSTFETMVYTLGLPTQPVGSN